MDLNVAKGTRYVVSNVLLYVQISCIYRRINNVLYRTFDSMKKLNNIVKQIFIFKIIVSVLDEKISKKALYHWLINTFNYEHIKQRYSVIFRKRIAIWISWLSCINQFLRLYSKEFVYIKRSWAKTLTDNKALGYDFTLGIQFYISIWCPWTHNKNGSFFQTRESAISVKLYFLDLLPYPNLQNGRSYESKFNFYPSVLKIGHWVILVSSLYSSKHKYILFMYYLSPLNFNNRMFMIYKQN